MKTLFLQLLTLFFISSISLSCYSQFSINDTFSYEIAIVYPPISINKTQLKSAETLEDLNRFFKPSWVKEFYQTMIKTIENNKAKITIGESNNLTEAQKINLLRADPATEVEVHIRYLPNNTLKHNEQKEMDFSLMIDPDTPAQFIGGQAALNQYLKNEIIDHYPYSLYKQYTATITTFTINEKGQVINAEIFQSTGDEQTDTIILNAICNMPDWKPAQYDNGKIVSQNFSFNLGDLSSCSLNLLLTKSE